MFYTIVNDIVAIEKQNIYRNHKDIQDTHKSIAMQYQLPQKL